MTHTHIISSSEYVQTVSSRVCLVTCVPYQHTVTKQQEGSVLQATISATTAISHCYTYLLPNYISNDK
eukprot:1207-Heterococcus_DN1.PRE.3